MHMKTLKAFVIVAMASLVLMGCGRQSSSSANGETSDAQEKAEKEKPELVHQWSTDKVMKTPESVCYDPEREVLYVANIQGKPTNKDGKGFISRLSTEGEVLDLEWVDGLDAPKGMGVYQGKLYVTNIDEIVEIDIAAGKVANRYSCPGAQFANDIAINNSGVVFASDMAANLIYRLEGESVETWLESDKLKSPNGLFTTNDKLMIGIDGSVLQVNYDGGQLETYIPGTGSIDGLEAVEGKHYIKSDWAGHIHLLHPGKDKILLLDTADDDINAADIEYVPGTGMLYVPTFHDNRVMAYKLNME